MRLLRRKTLTYWAAACLDDHSAYNIRALTRREARALIAERGPDRYGPVVKVTVRYLNAFDLLTMCLGEGSPMLEADADLALND